MIVETLVCKTYAIKFVVFLRSLKVPKTKLIKHAEWVLVSLTGKVIDSWIRNLGSKPHLYQKPTGVLGWW